MKKWLIFGGGFLTGIILVLLIGLAINKSNKDITLFKEPGEIVDAKTFKVFQVVNKNAALVFKHDSFDYTVYLLINDEDRLYYDDEIIEVPDGMVARHVGRYQYIAKSESMKTVPIIQIMNE